MINIMIYLFKKIIQSIQLKMKRNEKKTESKPLKQYVNVEEVY